MTQDSAMRGVPYVLQPAGTTTGNGNVLAIPSNFREHRVTITGSAGIASGAVQLESADDPAYAGTWQAIGSPVTAVASAELAVAVEGIFQFIRARISTNIVGGSVAVSYIGTPAN